MRDRLPAMGLCPGHVAPACLVHRPQRVLGDILQPGRGNPEHGAHHALAKDDGQHREQRHQEDDQNDGSKIILDNRDHLVAGDEKKR